MAKTEYRFLGISVNDRDFEQRMHGQENPPTLNIAVGKSERIASIPMSERDLLKVISDATTQLENLRKKREMR